MHQGNFARGMFVGISTGASLAAINKIKEELEGKRVLTFAYDTGERYLSVAILPRDLRLYKKPMPAECSRHLFV